MLLDKCVLILVLMEYGLRLANFGKNHLDIELS